LVHSCKNQSFRVAHRPRALIILQGQGWISIANKASDINAAGREASTADFHLLYIQGLQDKPSEEGLIFYMSHMGLCQKCKNEGTVFEKTKTNQKPHK